MIAEKWHSTSSSVSYTNACLALYTAKGLDIPSEELSSPRSIPKYYQGYAFPILNILVPHTGHVPCVAGLPFFIVMLLVSLISLLARHFTQYACISVHPLFDMNDRLFVPVMSIVANN